MLIGVSREGVQVADSVVHTSMYYTCVTLIGRIEDEVVG